MTKTIRLREWEEVVGIFEGLEISEFDVAVVLSSGGEKFQIRAEGVAAEIVKKELLACKPGSRIAILRTDDTPRPLVIRKIGSNERPFDAVKPLESYE